MRRNLKIITKAVDDKIMLLDPGNGEMRILNEVAGIIWKMLGEKKSAEKIASKISESYTVSRKKALIDVKLFIDRYIKDGLLLPSKRLQ